MKLTKKLETDILKGYKEYWDANLKGDMRTKSFWMHDNIHMIGSAKEEIFDNKKKAIKYYKSTAKQLAGKADIRNRKISASLAGNDILVNEECDFFALIDSVWTLYGEVRISTLFTKTNKGWKIIQEHFSLPDARTSGGEQINTDKIKAENIQLRDAIKRRTIELEEKNGELEIETALEKVRAVAMGMQKPEDLSAIGKIIFTELKTLGFSGIRNTEIVINSEDKESVKSYHYSDYGREEVIEINYKENPIVKKWATDLKKADNIFVPVTIREKQIKEWKVYRKKLGYKTDPKMASAKAVHYYSYSTGLGALSISTWEKLSKEQIQIFERFRNVFQLSYKRYIDITVAEEQAREAQIQLALERVRARSMAMHHSDEITDVVKLLYKEFDKLKLSNESTDIEIGLIDEETGVAKVWAHLYLSDGSISTFSFPFAHFDEISHEFNRWKSTPVKKRNELFITTEFSGKDWNRFKKLAKEVPELAEMFDALIKANIKKWVTHNAYFSHGLLTLQGTEHYSPETLEIQKRFAKVFEQTYIRFLDLKKAEEQAREAQIEVAVERVRAKALAMHKSEDLHGVVATLKRELMGLNIPGVTAVTIYLEHDDSHIRIVDLSDTGEKEDDPTHMKLDKILNIEDIDPGLWVWKIWNDKRKYFVVEADEDDFRRVVRWLYTIDKKEARMAEKIIHEKSIKRAWLPTIKLLKGSLNIDLLQPPGPEIESILSKMGAGFDLAYKRFLDLQKAEAQAREAEIELALERVRARAMAMQRPSEFVEVINVIGEQFIHLGFDIEWANFGATGLDIASGIDTWNFAVIPGSPPISSRLFIPRFDHPIFADAAEQIENFRKNGDDLFETNYDKEIKDRWLDHLFENTFFKDVPVEYRNIQYAKPGFITSNLALKDTFLSIGKFDSKSFTAGQNMILRRFGNAFGQAYTRFLDLQKAEAQAREAQIEAALERVRARAMAMHNSDELKDVAMELRNQMGQLGQKELEVCAIHLYESDPDFFESWGAMRPPGQEDKIFQGVAKFPKSGVEIIDEMMNLYRSGQKDYVIVNEKEKAQEWFEVMKKYTPEAHAILMRSLKDIPKDKIIAYWSLSDFSGGSLLMVTHSYPDETSRNLLRRSANVFELAYRRFKDLKKSEEQSREANIELGLERVRARAMAMQSSGELSDLVNTVFKELTRLDFALNWCIINIIDAPSLTNTVWAANPDINKAPESYLMKFEDYRFHHAMMKGYQERKTKYVYTLEGEEKKIYDEYLFKDTEFRKVPAEAQAASRAMEKYVVTFTFSNFGGLQTVTEVPLSDSSIDILSRFGKVFDLTYTRFNDLLKAEAQARESQIQLALERVRARTMAMHKSEELPETSHILFEQMKELGEPVEQLTIGIVDEENKVVEISATLLGDTLKKIYRHSIDEPYMMNKVYNAWKKQQKILVVELNGDELNAYNKYRNELTKSEMFPTNFGEEHRRIVYAAFFSKGMLALGANEPRPSESIQLLERFASVFELTYTRFLDLQKAEAQAREAQIEAALERVRSRSMGMQKSEELKEVIRVVFDQLIHLNIKLDHAGFVVDYKPKGDWTFWIADEQEIPSKITHPWFDSIWANQFDEAKEKGIDFFATYLNFEEKNKFYQDLFNYIPGLSEQSKEFYFNCPGLAASNVLMDNVALYIENFSAIPYSDEENKILMRFGKVFQQTYTRFLDLQKAEAQAREAQIEAALEKVRSRSMGMQDSNELAEVATMLFQQVKALGVPQWTCGFCIFEIDDKEFTWYPGGPDGEILPPSRIPLLEHPIFIQFNESRKRGDELFIYEKTGEMQADHYRYMLSLPVVGEYLQSRLDAGEVFPDFQIDHLANFSHGNLVFITYEHFPQMHDIFKRFAKVFDQTYTRFLDLQKAEAQAREAQIEASLERIRSRTMGMQKTDELKEIVALLYEESNKFGFESVLMIINTRREEDDGFNWWFSANEQTVLPQSYFIPDLDEPVLRDIKSIWESGKPDGYIQMGGNLKREHDRRLFSETGLRELPNHLKEMMRSYESVFLSIANMKNGFIEVAANEFISGDRANILQRYAKVFEQTYTRFLDLQKAEAQAREAQIEAALERVRSRSIAMRKSEEIAEITGKIFSELRQLDIALNRVLIWTFNDAEKYISWWSSNPEIENTAESYRIDYNDNPVFLNYLQAWQKREPINLFTLSGETKKTWEDHLFEHTEMSRLPMKIRKGMRAEGTIYTVSVISDYGLMMSGSFEPLPETSIDIIQRFGRVFQQSYTRYLDVQKAEVQAREAEIELGLERVRARTMAMQKSDELKEVVQTLSTEIGKLDIIFTRTTIVIYDPDTLASTWWLSNPETSESFGLFVKYHEHRPYLSHVEAWRDRKRSWQYVLEGDDKKQWDRFIFNETDLSHLPEHVKDDMQGKEKVCLSCSFSNFGYLVLESPESISSEQFDILYRFAKVFDLTYTRFMDIQKAEAQARESQIEAGLERVRSRTLAMQRTEELAETAAVLIRQLNNLGIEANRIYIGITVDDSTIIEFWITDEDGSQISTRFKGDASKNISMKKMYDAWKQKEKSLVIDMHGKELEEYFHYLGNVLNVPFKGGHFQKRRWQYVAFFSKGFIGLASQVEQPAETMNLLERFAGAFNLTFTRFNDLKIAEAHALKAQQDLIEIKEARTKAEVALAELQATQKQLVQSEKMASLGELTAGIAHEIQNPLNFVNNFSDVNKELLEELIGEAAKGNLEEVKIIANDLINNEEKISHHGKRADAIVKGMLQHSRTSGGQKVSTDINALCDEYLRLAFHGLRAKDKSFNAAMKTEFDAGAGLIDIIPQDIGRVILNLINNAFYAVNEKVKSEKLKVKDGLTNYEPLVTVSTKTLGEKLEISIMDNGNGIPDSIKEKIFQPFFTTKPTGSGTGLGLSLSYDIVKAHGGEIKVKSIENEGSEFIINLNS